MRTSSSDPPDDAAGGEQRTGKSTALALFAMALGVFVIANDFTALGVALPTIESDFNVDVGSVQWVINAYALVFGIAIVTGGRLADMLGRQRAFYAGAAIFAAFSALGAAAPDLGFLIGARVGMGIGAALMWPAVLGMTYAALPESKAGLAGGIILGVAGFGNAVGPLLGGALTEALDWRWIFIINVPIALFAITVVRLAVHQHQPLVKERIDYAGIATLSLGLLLLLLALDQSVDWGWGDPRVIAMLVVSAAMLVGFSAVERRAGDHSLLPRDVIGNTRFRRACISVVLASAVFFAVVLYVPQFLQKILDYSAIEAGLGMLPMMASFALTSFAAGGLYDRIGMRASITIGAGLLAAGPLMLALMLEPDSGVGTLVPGLLVTGFGVGMFYPSVTTAAVTALDSARASLAGGIVYMCQIAGGAIGLGVTTTIFTTVSENRLSDLASSRAGVELTERQQSVLHGDLAGTDAAAAALAELPGRAVAEIEQIVRESFVDGLETSFAVIAGVAVIGFFVAVFGVGRSD